MKITFVISSLKCGGAERVLALLAQGLAARKHSVSVVTLNSADTDFFTLPNGIRRIALNPGGKSANILQGVFKALRNLMALRQAVLSTSPDVVVSSMDITNVKILLLFKWTKLPVVVSERNNPQMDPIGPAWKWLRRWTYSFTARLVTQTKRAQASFPPAIQARTTVIPNPVPPLPQAEHTPTDVMLAKPALVAMGNFYPQKGFDLLLKALARLKDRHPAWTLTILGEGPLRTQIESLRDALGLNDRVHLPGRVKNPHHVLKQADLFVLSSRWEGWPMALAEAMSCGLPVIAADCRMGPREIVRDGVDGVLVPPEDVEALAAAMDKLMSDESTRKRLASRAREVTERFPLEKVMSMWEELLRTVVLK